MNELTNRIPEVRRMIATANLQGKHEAPIRPSKLYRMAVRPTQKPYDFKKAKARRKMAKQSRRINRKQ